MKIINISRELRLGYDAFNFIAKLQHQCIHSNEMIEVNLINAKSINPAFITILGSLPEISEKHHKYFKGIVYNPTNKNNKKIIRDTGIWGYYEEKAKLQKKNKTMLFHNIEKNQIERYLDDLLSCIPVNLEQNLKGLLSTSIIEVFNNAFEHGKPDKGVYCSGKFDSSKKNFIFSLYDAGIGIKQNVGEYLKSSISDKFAVEWALSENNSTRINKNIPGGNGLKLIEQFINANHGKIYMLSGNALCKIVDSKRIIDELDNPIQGTLFIMDIKTDKTNKYVYTKK